MVIRRISMAILAVLFFNVGSKAQVSESCDCMVDTSGLKSFLSTLSLNENQPLVFEVQNTSSTFAVLHGYIDGSTPSVVQAFITNYPNVTTLVFMQMPGSDDDNANLIVSQALRNQGYKHYLPSVNAYSQDAFIASGAVDMFVGGLTRVVDTGAEVGVHSWSDGVNDATDYPVGHAYHLPYINYYVNMGFTQQEAEDFYYFTINAAPASGIHFMTESELNQYKIRTCTYSATPDYSVSQNGSVLEANLAGATYQWIDCSNNAPITGETSQSYTVTSNGSFAVIVSESTCVDTSDCITVNNVGMIDHSEPQLKVFPNPASTHIVLEGVTDVECIEILSVDGSKVYAIKEFRKNIDISELPKGTYLIQVKNRKALETIRFIKK